MPLLGVAGTQMYHVLHFRGANLNYISSHPLVYWKPESKGVQETLSTEVAPAEHTVQTWDLCEMQA